MGRPHARRSGRCVRAPRRNCCERSAGMRPPAHGGRAPRRHAEASPVGHEKNLRGVSCVLKKEKGPNSYRSKNKPRGGKVQGNAPNPPPTDCPACSRLEESKCRREGESSFPLPTSVGQIDGPVMPRRALVRVLSLIVHHGRGHASPLFRIIHTAGLGVWAGFGRCVHPIPGPDLWFARAADCADASVCGPPPICSVLAAMRSHHSSTYGRTSPQRTAMDSPNRFGTPNHTPLHTAHHTQEPQASL